MRLDEAVTHYRLARSDVRRIPTIKSMLASSSQIDDAAAVPGFMSTYFKGCISSASEIANITDVETIEKRKGRKRKIEPMDLPEDNPPSYFSMRSWMEFRYGFVETP